MFQNIFSLLSLRFLAIHVEWFQFFYFFAWTVTGCKESQFYSLPFGQAVALHVAHKSFQLAPKSLLISRIYYSPSVIWISQKNSTCPSGKLRTKFTSPIAKSPIPGLSDTTFFPHCSENQQYIWLTFVWIPVIVNFQDSNDDSPAGCLAQLDDNNTHEVIQIVCCLVILCLTYNIVVILIIMYIKDYSILIGWERSTVLLAL